MMPYLFIVFAGLLILSLIGSKDPRSPLLSEQSNEIVSHMTQQEKAREIRIGVIFGLLLAIMFGLGGTLLGFFFFSSILKGMAVMGMMFPFLMILFAAAAFPMLKNFHKKRLASTAWARDQGIEAERIQLYRWEKVAE